MTTGCGGELLPAAAEFCVAWLKSAADIAPATGRRDTVATPGAGCSPNAAPACPARLAWILLGGSIATGCGSLRASSALNWTKADDEDDDAPLAAAAAGQSVRHRRLRPALAA